MAYGGELWLGFVGEDKVMEIASSLGIAVDKDRIGNFELPKEMKERLDQAHKDALEELGLKIIDHSRLRIKNNFTGEENVPPERDHVYVQSPDGFVHELQKFDCLVDYDPREMGHEPKDMLIGVSLVTRYFPVFLDWKSESGGSGDTFSLTPDVLANIEIARKHIAKVLPFIQDAPIVFREIHY